MNDNASKQQETAKLMQPFVAMSKFGLYSTAAMTDVWLGAMRGFIGAVEETGQIQGGSKTSSNADKPSVDKKKAAAGKPVSKKVESVIDSDTIAEDDLKLITGVGPKLERILKRKNITTFARIASLKAKDIKELDEKLALSGRIERDKWIDQAKALIRNK